MTLRPVTLHLPQDLMQRARQSAEVLQQPLDNMLTDAIDAVLPDLEGVPKEMQPTLLRMIWLDDHKLWEFARSTMPKGQQEQLQFLADLQTQRPLTPDEAQSLEQLQQEYSRITLCKARAYALLSLRGGKPLLAGT